MPHRVLSRSRRTTGSSAPTPSARWCWCRSSACCNTLRSRIDSAAPCMGTVSRLSPLQHTQPRRSTVSGQRSASCRARFTRLRDRAQTQGPAISSTQTGGREGGGKGWTPSLPFVKTHVHPRGGPAQVVPDIGEPPQAPGVAPLSHHRLDLRGPEPLRRVGGQDPLQQRHPEPRALRVTRGETQGPKQAGVVGPRAAVEAPGDLPKAAGVMGIRALRSPAADASQKPLAQLSRGCPMGGLRGADEGARGRGGGGGERGFLSPVRLPRRMANCNTGSVSSRPMPCTRDAGSSSTPNAMVRVL